MAKIHGKLDFEFLGVFNIIGANFETAKRSEIGASAEFFANVLSKGANVGARGDMTTYFEGWIGIVEDVKLVYRDGTSGSGEILALTSELIGAATIDFYGAKFGYSLELFANEMLERGLNR